MKRRNRDAKSKVQYGKSYRYGSTERAIKDLTRLEKKQREEKAKREAEKSANREGK